ncbi:NADH:ubiquinone oxidoreductase, Na [Pasteurella skyensis]|nr:NADH:ubiquinone oxidoreductase, Na [Pasteurella skyensis]
MLSYYSTESVMRFILLLLFSFFSTQLFALSGEQLVKDARSQIGTTLFYDPAYTKLTYPMGDIPMIKGVCTDVVIRALRKQGMDLQKLIHEDMQKHFSQYPKKWGLKKTDKNIDHRRVPNIATYFKRKGYEIKTDKFQRGDIVTWDLGRGITHIGIISDKKSGDIPLVIHNIGYGTQENNILYNFKITGIFRIPSK